MLSYEGICLPKENYSQKKRHFLDRNILLFVNSSYKVLSSCSAGNLVGFWHHHAVSVTGAGELWGSVERMQITHQWGG